MSLLREFLSALRAIPSFLSMRANLYAIDVQLARHHECGVPISLLSEAGRFDGDGLDADREMPWCIDCDVVWPCPDVEALMRERLEVREVTA